MPDTRLPLGHALLDALKAHGVREIFGIPGDFVLPFFKAIEETGTLPFYTLSHEPAVGFAADAAARFHGGLSVAVATWGAGAFNLVNPVAGAYAERVPVVVISGAPGVHERASGWRLHHMSREIDTQTRIFREITCDMAVLDDPARAPADIARVLRSAREHSLPVYLELPRDLVGAATAPVPVLPPSPVLQAAVDEAAAEILHRLRAAASPCIMVDVEVRRYGAEARVAELAGRLGIPVVGTFMGRGLLSGHSGVVRGTYMGAAGQRAVTELVEGSDGLLLLGVILSDTNFAVSERKIDMRRAMLAINREVQVGHHVYQGVPLDRLVDALLDQVQAGRSGGRGRRPCRTGSRPRRSRTAWWRTARRSRPATSPPPSTTCSRSTARCRSRPTWATACSRRWRSATRTWWRPATTRAWATACRPGWARAWRRAGGR